MLSGSRNRTREERFWIEVRQSCNRMKRKVRGRRRRKKEEEAKEEI